MSAKTRYYYTAEMLEKNGACDEQVAKFRETFGNRRVFLTLKNVEKAQSAGLRIWWVTAPLMRDFSCNESHRLFCAIDSGRPPAENLPLMVEAAELLAHMRSYA